MTIPAELRRAQEQIDSAIRHFDVGNYEDALVYLHAARATIRDIGARLDGEKKPLRRFAVVRAAPMLPLSPQADGGRTTADEYAAASDEPIPPWMRDKR